MNNLFPDLEQKVDLLEMLTHVPSNDQLVFLENLYTRLADRFIGNPNATDLLNQVVRMVAPNFEKKGRFYDAAQAWEKIGKFESAQVDYIRENRLEDAARCAELNHHPNEAIELYQKSGMLQKAAEVAAANGFKIESDDLFKKAIDSFVSQHEFHLASLAARKAGKIVESLKLEADHIDRIGYVNSSLLYRDLVDEAERLGNFDLAIDLAVRGDLYDRARDIANDCHQTEKIPDIFRHQLDAVYVNQRLPVFKEYINFLSQHGSNTACQSAYSQEIASLKSKKEFFMAAQVAEMAGNTEANGLYRLALDKATKEADFKTAYVAAEKLGLNNDASVYISLSKLIN